MIQNYIYVNKNKIYGEIYDELLDEELSMYNNEHNDKIKYYIQNKIKKEKYIEVSEKFNSNDDIISDLIIKITSDINNNNLQGNTILMFADNDCMYELFHMEDLTKKQEDIELNEFGSISNIHMTPIYWGFGIFKSTYKNGILETSIIDLDDLSNIFIQNYYHQGIMIGVNDELTEIEFTGEDPFRVIGNNFTLSNVTDVLSFNILPYIESNGTIINNIGSLLLGREIKGRVFISLLCPTTRKKYWNIDVITIKNIINILRNKNLTDLILQSIEISEKDINPFYFIKKTMLNKIYK